VCPIPQRRRTSQREAILEALRRRRWHPTADEVYAEVRESLPRISLGTVYRNLELLCSQGLARRIESPGGPRRFDADVSSHMHARCAECGRVEDVQGEGSRALAELLRRLEGQAKSLEQSSFRVEGVSLVLTGVCARCAARRRDSAGQVQSREQ